MTRLKDFPPFKLCKLCEGLFSNYRDHCTGERDTIQRQIWDESRGYRFTRTRDELEKGAMEGCELCGKIARRDVKYRLRPKNDEDARDGETEETLQERWSAIHGSVDNVTFFSRPRPEWFPHLNERLEFKVNYYSHYNRLVIHDREGQEWVDCLEFHMHTTHDDPASKLVSSSAPSSILSELASPESFQTVRQWMDECFHGHSECPPDAPVPLPTRLIKVSPLGKTESAQLCDTAGRKGEYCALSYCWGGNQPFKTLHERYPAYSRELPYANLPQTIRDAFQVTRSVGLEYIWIDSLCIIQDDKDDVQREMAKMVDIYRNTRFTISAANASTCEQGFLQRQVVLKDSRDEQPLHLPVRVDEGTMGSVLVTRYAGCWTRIGANSQPINERAWTLQEALLTPRLLIFTNIHVIWKCQAGSKPEVTRPPCFTQDKNDQENPWLSSLMLLNFSFLTTADLEELSTFPVDPPMDGSSADLREWTSIRGEWCGLVKDYTLRKLSVATDKLPAISAIARTFAPMLKSDYLAGLWRRYLLYDLMWYAFFTHSPGLCDSGSPSWSWAALKGGVWFVQGEEIYTAAEVEDCSVELVYPQDPYGMVRGGELVIRGPFSNVALHGGSVVHPALDGAVLGDFYSDHYTGDALVKHDSNAFCLTLAYGRREAAVDSYSLVLAAVANREGYYRRIGFLSAREKGFWWESSEKKRVTIV